MTPTSFYITNKGYGVLVDNEGDAAYEIASEKVERVQFSVEGERLDYYVINGHTPKGTIQKYTELTGKPALPPAWSFGVWLTTSFTTNYDEETTSSFINGMADRDIPLHVFHFDCYWMEAYEWCNFVWDPKTFPDPKGMLKRYHDRGLKICVWINPYIGQKSPLFQEGMKQGYLVKKTNGDVWQTDLWQAGMGLVDFTNPEAVKWYTGMLKSLLDMGVDCFKTDFGERIPVKDIVYYDGSDPVKMHNYYTFLYNQAVFRLLEQERGEGEAVLFARSATVGGQQFPAHWGDSLLAAPVFKESGEVEYYLPEGKWQKETHDYFTMPLLVRPNTILAVGSCDTKPDYEFWDGVTLCLSVFEDGAEACTEITDIRGKIVMTAKALRIGNTITLHVEGRKNHWKYQLLGEENVSVVVE